MYRLSLSITTPAFRRNAFANTQSRLSDLVQEGQAHWRAGVSGVPGSEGRPLQLRRGSPMVRLFRESLASSIQTEEPTVSGDTIRAAIVSIHPGVAVLEDGGETIDLHDMLATAPKARLSKKGRLYLRIPFPMGGPGQASVPKAARTTLAGRSRFRVTGSSMSPSVTRPGQTVRRYRYRAGAGRLSQHEAAQIGHPHLAGLMRTSGNRALTIRTLSQANPSGWRVRAYPAQQLAKQTTDHLRDMIEQGWFQDAIQTDIQESTE